MLLSNCGDWVGQWVSCLWGIILTALIGEGRPPPESGWCHSPSPVFEPRLCVSVEEAAQYQVSYVSTTVDCGCDVTGDFRPHFPDFLEMMHYTLEL